MKCLQEVIHFRFLSLICFCVIIGCSGLKTERTVQDGNIFHSSNRPTIRVKINPHFKFQESADNLDSNFVEEYGEKASNVKIDQFSFLKSSKGEDKGVLIIIRELKSPNWFYKPPIFRAKNELESGHMNIQGKKYRYCMYIAKKSNDYFLAKGIGKIFGTNKNGIIFIFYYEQVPGDWSNINLLTTDQQRRVKEFIEASKKNIEILE